MAQLSDGAIHKIIEKYISVFPISDVPLILKESEVYNIVRDVEKLYFQWQNAKDSKPPMIENKLISIVVLVKDREHIHCLTAYYNYNKEAWISCYGNNELITVTEWMYIFD